MTSRYHGTAAILAGVLAPVAAGYRATMRGIHAIGWRRTRYGCAAGYFAVLIYQVLAAGVPTDRDTLSAIVIVGLAITCLGRGWRRLLQVGLDWLPFTIVLMTYDKSRALADTLGMPLHEADIAHAESWLFGGTVPTVWFQQHFYDPVHVHLYDALATLLYTSHFVVTPLLAAVFWLRARRTFLRYIGRVIVLSFAGLITYVLFPEAPPWMAAQDGLIGGVSRISARGWEYLHASFANRLLIAGQSEGSNPVAAMPSLHFAFALLAALFLAERLRRRWRYLLYLYPLAMGLTLVYTGEHYVLDLAFGAVYAVAVHVLLLRVEAWYARRQVAVTTVPDVDEEIREPVAAAAP